MKRHLAFFAAAAAACLLAAGAVRAEPHLAVRAGLKCMACHTNPTGGGKRTEFGSGYGQTALAAGTVGQWFGDASADASAQATPWIGKLSEYFAVGGDVRANASSTKVPGSKETAAFGPTSAQLYLEFKPLGDRLLFYLDERVSPGSAAVREGYALLWFGKQAAYVKVGRLFVPFGLRLEDDTAFIRQATGVNFASSDDGVEGGLEIGPWSAALSITNGAGGGEEINRGKLISAIGNYVQADWRAGVSASYNRVGGANRSMQSVFGGVRTGIVSWLASAVFINDEGTPFGRIKQRLGFIEGNVEPAKGHNLRLAYEYLDPDTAVREDQRVRYSAVWEYVPFQFTQFRLGARKNDGIPQNPAQNATELFAQWHAYF